MRKSLLNAFDVYVTFIITKITFKNIIWYRLLDSQRILLVKGIFKITLFCTIQFPILYYNSFTFLRPMLILTLLINTDHKERENWMFLR